MNKKPKVSVIIPIFCVEKYIERCARSLFEQTLDDIEYLFIDDCSPDKSIEILERVLDDYPRRRSQVTIHRMQQNCGLGRIREWGIKHANGEYMIHCDSDDWVDIHIYELMYTKAIKTNADIVICGYQVHDGVKALSIYDGGKSDDKDTVLRDVLYQNIAGTLWNKLVKSTLYSNFILYPQHSMGEDIVLSSQLLYYSKRISHVPQSLYYYFLNENSIVRKSDSVSIINKYHQFNNNINLIESFASQLGILHQYQRGLVWLRCSAVMSLMHKDSDCMKMFRKNFSLHFLSLLFDMNVNNIRKIQLIKNSIKSLISYGNK